MSCEHAKVVPWSECSKCDKCGEEGICEACRWGDLKTPGQTDEQYLATVKHKCPETIRICRDCDAAGIQVPLVWTFAFPGCEYWCPVCGATMGMLGAGKEVAWTEGLHHRAARYKRIFGAYLDAHGALCCAQLMWDGKMIPPRDLPAVELQRLKVVAETGWTAGVVIL